MGALILALALSAALQDPRPSEPAVDAARLFAQIDQEIGAGDYAAAKRHAREAAAQFAARGDLAGQSRALNRLGQAALYEGAYGDAADAFRTAANISAAAGDLEAQAEQLGNLGNVHFFVGGYSDAARTYDAALAVVDRAGPASWAAYRRRILRINQAALFQRLGRYQEALEVYQGLGGDDDLSGEERAQLLVNRGALYRRLGDPVKALVAYEAARELFSKDQHVDGELGALGNRGIVFALDLQQLDVAEQTFSEAVALAVRTGNRREQLHGLLYRGETRRRAGSTASAHLDFTAALGLAEELRTPEEEWKALYGLARTEPDGARAQALLARAVEVIEAVRERIRVPTLRSDFFNDKAEVYDALIAARLGQGSAPEIFRLLERRHSRAWRDRLGLTAALELATVQQALPEGVLLLDYWSAPGVAAVVAATRTRATLLPVVVTEDDIKALDDVLAAGDQGDWQGIASRVGGRVLPPADWLDGVRHVIVVPAGVLTLVPFELLSNGGRMLLERAAVTYVPTAATLLRPGTDSSGWQPPWRVLLRAFANPVFGDARLGEAASEGTRLMGSEVEVRTIASAFAGGEVLHVGPDNRKAYLFDRTPAPPILHIASHASADVAAIERSRIVFSPATSDSRSADYLFLKEAYDLPLDGVELAVLSACETERGRLMQGEGVQSFSRAFLAAGARTTVTTLWRVPDAPTARFMEGFYSHLQRGASRAEALRQAKLRFLRSGSRVANPHYWAAFVLTGDGLQPVPRAVSWTWLVASAVVAAALLVLGLKARRRRTPLFGG